MVPLLPYHRREQIRRVHEPPVHQVAIRRRHAILSWSAAKQEGSSGVAHPDPGSAAAGRADGLRGPGNVYVLQFGPSKETAHYGPTTGYSPILGLSSRAAAARESGTGSPSASARPPPAGRIHSRLPLPEVLAVAGRVLRLASPSPCRPSSPSPRCSCRSSPSSRRSSSPSPCRSQRSSSSPWRLTFPLLRKPSSSPSPHPLISRGHMMQSLLRNACRAGSRGAAARLLDFAAPVVATRPSVTQSSSAIAQYQKPYGFSRLIGSQIILRDGVPAASGFYVKALTVRGLSTVGNAEVASSEDDSSSPAVEHPPRIKFKRLDKTARHIMNILNKEAVEKVRSEREIPDVQPGCIIQMRLQVPENKRRESTLKGIVIARRNAGINTTFRLRRLVAGVGVESVFPLYSPNIKEIKVLDRKKVRRAKLYYLRDRMNALRK